LAKKTPKKTDQNIDNTNSAVGGEIPATTPNTIMPDNNTKKIFIADEITLVPTDRIKPDPEQPRKFFDIETQEQLKHSIDSEGLHNPILIRKDELKEDHYIIVDGQRRWQACLELNHLAIKCRTVESDAQGYKLLSLTQNLHREDLLPVEKAMAFATIYEKMKGENKKARQKELNKIVNLSESFISELLKISTLSVEMKKEASKSKKWSVKKLLRLSKIKNLEQREATFKELKAIITNNETRKWASTGDFSRAGFSTKEELDEAGKAVAFESFLKRIDFWKNYVEKSKKYNLDPSQKEAIKSELKKLLDLLD
jgi:ParB family chromosome partitioning protein